MMTPDHATTLSSSQRLFVSACEAKLAGSTTLLTITGSPGVGKTTVLRALADERARQIVDLRHVADESSMLSALASALELHHEPPRGKPPEPVFRRAQILDALRAPDAPRLLIDHSAHLHDPLEVLLSELGQGPHTTIVVASRRAFELGERMELGALDEEDACELLIASAPASRREALARSRDELVLLVRALEHNPLAIKVCAPRLGLFNPKDVLERLRTQRGKNAHTVLGETFAWSWELLDAHAKQDLTRCAVCTGWFDDHIGAAILETTPEDARERLGVLHDHSLIDMEQRSPDAALRYRMSRPLVIFIEEMAQPSMASARARLATYVASRSLALHRATLGNRWHITKTLLPDVLAGHIMPSFELWKERWTREPSLHVLERLVESLLGAQLLLWMRQDFTRLRAIHDWLEDEISSHALCAKLDKVHRVRLTCVRSDYCTLLYDTHRALALMHELADEELPDELELLRLVRLAEMEPQLGIAHAQAHIERGLALAQALDEVDAQASLMLARARLHLEKRQTGEALVEFERTRAFAQTLSNKRALARVLLFQGYTMHGAGQPQEGNALIDASREAFAAHGDIIGAAHALRVRAWHSVDDQDFARSQKLIEDTIAMGTRHGLDWMHAFGYFLLGQHELDQQHYAQAQIAYERARYHLERQHMDSMLAASQLYRSICYKLTGDMEMARRIFEEGREHLDAVRSTAGKMHYMCEQAEWIAFDGDRPLALDMLEKARELIEGCREQDLLPSIVEVYQCKIDLKHYFELRDAHEPTEHIYKNILERLSRLHIPMKDSPKRRLDSCIEVRLAWAGLKRALPEEFMRRFLVELQDPYARALLIDARERAYRAPEDYTWVTLGKKENPYNLLLLLVEQHLNHPGEPVDDVTILAHLWPDEIIAPQAAKNRLHVTLSSLRNSGPLKPHILNHPDGGYMLARTLHVYEV